LENDIAIPGLNRLISIQNAVHHGSCLIASNKSGDAMVNAMTKG
jgi:hypothetical protein